MMHGRGGLTAAFVVRGDRATALVETGPKSALDRTLRGLQAAGVKVAVFNPVAAFLTTGGMPPRTRDLHGLPWSDRQEKRSQRFAAMRGSSACAAAASASI